MTTTALEPLNANFTKWNGEWMIRTDRQITSSDRVPVMRCIIGGGEQEQMIAYVEVKTKSGEIKTVEVAEYEAKTSFGHIYSFRNI